MKKILMIGSVTIALLLLSLAAVSCGTPQESAGDNQPGQEMSDTSTTVATPDTSPEETAAGETAGEIAVNPSVDIPGTCRENGHDFRVMQNVEASCFYPGCLVSVCRVCNYMEEEEWPRLAHRFEDGYCVLCGLNEHSETNFRYMYQSDTDSFVITLPRDWSDWGKKETVILPTVYGDADHGLCPVTGCIGLFENNAYVRNVIIPEGYTLIGDRTFSGAPNLDHVELPSTITSIGKMAFLNVRRLTEMVLPEGVTTIGESAFDSCQALRNIIVPDTVTSIDASAFARTAITSIHLPEGLTRLPNGLFSGCASLTDVNIPSTVTYIGALCFYGVAIRELIIPEGVTWLGRIVECPYLERVVLPESLTYTENDQFRSCPQLRQINIPAGLNDPGDFCYECPNLTDIQIAPSYPYLTIRDGMLIRPKTHTLIRVLNGAAELIIPGDGSITSISAGLNGNNSTVRRIVIPAAVSTLNVSAFQGFTALEEVVFEGERDTISFGSYCFAECTSLTSFTFPASARTVDACIFQGCTALREVTIPATFDSQPNSYRHSDMFADCKSLEKVYYDGTVEEWIRNINPWSLESLDSLAGDYIVICSDGEYDHHHA